MAKVCTARDHDIKLTIMVLQYVTIIIIICIKTLELLCEIKRGKNKLVFHALKTLKELTYYTLKSCAEFHDHSER